MKSYSPFHVDPRQQASDFAEPEDYESPSDYTLTRYVECYWQEFRRVIEQYFGDFSSSLKLYSNYPYISTVVRIGTNGVVIGHKPASKPEVIVLRAEEFDPALGDLNVLTLQQRLNTVWMSFDFRFITYDEEQARARGASDAFNQALGVFWQLLNPTKFEALCEDLVRNEGVDVESPLSRDRRPDLIGRAYLGEPGQFLREEVWGFELKHYREQRPSAALIRMAVAQLEAQSHEIDILCLVSSGDLTSIGRHVAIDNPRVRIWDRAVLDVLLHRHPETMGRYFQPYAQALERLQAEQAKGRSMRAKFEAALGACPPGLQHFREYEEIGLEVIRYLFAAQLGPLHPQSPTEDGVERRDVVSRNNRQSRLFQRVASLFDADFIIWDFKNYEQPVTGGVITDAAKYANPALGRFIVVMSRQGADESARKAQLRRYQNDKRMVLVISDEQCLEMVRRKESGQEPEDLLEDLLDELLLAI